MFSGCASVVNSLSSDLAENLSLSMKNQSDPEVVRQAIPAYLVLIDSLVESDPENPSTLMAASQLYGSYASAFVKETERAAQLSKKSFDYADQAICLELDSLCDAESLSLDEIQATLKTLDEDQISRVYDLSVAWAGKIQANSGDWNAIAQIPKLNALLLKVSQINPDIDQGNVWLYLGVLGSQIPPSLGGKPDQARQWFEQAIQRSNKQNLMASVMFAEHYARLVFDQQLHDSLLQDVLSRDPESPGLTLLNTLAQSRARELLAESQDFF